MVKKLTKRDEHTLFNLLYYLKNNYNEDFYLTEDNRRYYVNDYDLLKKLLKNTTEIYISDNGRDIEGIVLLWKSKGGDISRTYVKIHAKNEKIATKLMTVLLWNNGNELYIKINKISPYLNLLKKSNFKWYHYRGSQVLLKREKDMKVIEQIKNSRKLKEVREE